MKRWLTAVALVGLTLSLASCMNLWPEDPVETGYVQITIAPTDTTPQRLGPQAIPANADKLRLRIWNLQTGYNDVVTIALLPPGQTVAIEIPAGDNYIIDALSYENTGFPVALTGDRATQIDIALDDVTPVALVLMAWDVRITGDDTVAPEADYTLFFAPEDGGGVLSNDTFETVTLRVAPFDFADPAIPLPAIAGLAAHTQPDGVTLTAQAPDVAVDTTLFIAALFQFNQDWYDYSLPNVAEQSMFLLLPNRHMAQALHEIVVEPSIGGIEVDISSTR